MAAMKAGVGLAWADLKFLRRWTPLSQVTTDAVSLGDDLFKVGRGKFLICVPYNRDLEEQGGNRFVTTLVWAGTDGAARRAVLMQIEADQSSKERPPADLLPPGQPVTYGEIVWELKKGHLGEYEETASYRIASDGAFVHRHITTAAFSFHFRKREPDDSEPCYAIEYRLPEK